MMRYLFVLVTLVVLGSCSEKQRANLESKPGIIGRPNKVLVVMDETNWEGDLGDTLEYYYDGPFILTPKPEPIFDLSYAKPVEFIEYKRQLRTVLFVCNLADKGSPTSRFVSKMIGEEYTQRALDDPSFNYVIERGKWAENQLVIYMFGASNDAVANTLNTTFEKIANEIHESDQYTIRADAFAGSTINTDLKAEMKEKMSFSLDIPRVYRKVLDEDNTMWLRYDTKEVGYNIIINVRDYDENTPVTNESLLAYRNELVQFVGTENKETYMTTESEFLPVFYKNINLKNCYTIEARGTWKMVNDFMGGPFVSFMMYEPNIKKVVYIEGFIQAPGEERQRDHVQRIETILRTVAF